MTTEPTGRPLVTVLGATGSVGSAVFAAVPVTDPAPGLPLPEDITPVRSARGTEQQWKVI
ncbi:hypothetical protein [Streptomyces sp. cg35]|uniref:hypothetical protein n=1 Tax=Streptomyces sp. cg35 TaxID=3421650 RepID=UPI003D184185